jgi:hypothetical protein
VQPALALRGNYSTTARCWRQGLDGFNVLHLQLLSPVFAIRFSFRTSTKGHIPTELEQVEAIEYNRSNTDWGLTRGRVTAG